MMTQRINQSQRVDLKEGFNHLDVEVKGDLELSIVMPSHQTGNLFIKVTGMGSLKLEIEVEAKANYKYLWLNHAEGALRVHETIRLFEDAYLGASYGEMSLGNHTKTTDINFVGARSTVDFKGAIVGFDQLIWKINANHLAKKSVAHVNCNAIVLNDAFMHLEIAGKITKGNSGSETHQMSRIMNLGETAKGVVYPMLLIDENDVAASHAASVGQPNEEHIYYLQSRGLTRLESLKLITMGYLMPIVDGIDDAHIQEALKLEIEKKVNNQWV